MTRNRSILPRAVLVLLVATAPAAAAPPVPVRSYSPADGLVSGMVGRIVVDARGFLWACSGEGLSRFDGHSFRNFGKGDGVPSPTVHDVLFSRDGTFWLATGAGLSRLEADADRKGDGRAGPLVLPVPGAWQAATRLLEDSRGTLWCGGTDGISRVERSAGGFSLVPVDLGLPHRLSDDAVVSALVEAPDGSILVGTGSGVHRLLPGGRVEHPGTKGLGHEVRALAVLPDGSLWVATPLGIERLEPAGPGGEYRVAGHYGLAEGLSSHDVHSLLVSRDGRLWAGTATGLAVFEGGRFTSPAATDGVAGPATSLAEDDNGEIWTGGEGLRRYARSGVTTWGPPDGLIPAGVESLFAGRDGALHVSQNTPREAWIGRLEKERFVSRPAGIETAGGVPSWGWNQVFLEDREGDFWLATGMGLWRFSRDPARASPSPPRPRRVYTTADGLPDDGIFLVFEDSRGDVWISVQSAATNGLARWRRAEDRIESFQGAAGLPPLRSSLPTAFAEDRAGNVWIGFNGSGVARFRDGRFELFPPARGVPEGWVRALLFARDGRLWVGASIGGIAVAEDPTRRPPLFRPPDLRGSLSSSAVRCLVEDASGRIYAGHTRGVDRIDLARRTIHHLTTSDGLAPGSVRSACRDRDGTLWFGTSRGLSRLVPSEEVRGHTPPVFLTGVSVAGVAEALPADGAVEVRLPDIPPARGQVQVSFVSPGAFEADTVRYQYRLEGGADSWSREGAERSVDFASLAPGRYRFAVRAVAADGSTSPRPATVAFTVLAPAWRQPWFVALAASLAALAAWAGFRYRLGNLLEIERVRTRIAADLHDDIGSSLSRISILAEVVKRQTAGGNEGAERFLTDIAETSRSLVDSMGDIVWSIDPRRDTLQHLLGRVGQFAAGVLEARGIQWTLEVPPDPDHLRLAPEQRRGTYLVLKEAISNAVRHSGCRTLALRVTLSRDRLVAQVRDDGCGIPEALLSQRPAEASAARRGRGLLNMRARAREVGGEIAFSTGPHGGTVVRLDVPVRTGGRMDVLFTGRRGRRRIPAEPGDDP